MINLCANGKERFFSVIGDDGYPYTVPINFFCDEISNRMYFYGAKEGHKIDEIEIEHMT